MSDDISLVSYSYFCSYSLLAILGTFERSTHSSRVTSTQVIFRIAFFASAPKPF